MTPKDFYRSYIADDSLSELSRELIAEVIKYTPTHVLDFGCGSGKHLSPLNAVGICTIGIDISPMNVYKAIHKYDLPFVACGDESYLRNLCNIDVVFTCSVLDHIEDITGIIDEFKRICNKSVVIAETNALDKPLYYPHHYESYGFVTTGFEWVGEDGQLYQIWKWNKEELPKIESIIDKYYKSD